MELTPAQQARFKDILLQTYKSFKAFCEEHDIKYIAAGGTALGAVRHGGIIPWDDDIDVYMPREDYEKFLSLKGALAGSGYEIEDPSDKDYFCAMAKYADIHTSIQEFVNIPYIQGIYIDVFALDYDEGLYEEVLCRRMNYEKSMDLYRLSAIRRSWGEVFSTLAHGKLSSAMWYLFQKCVIRSLRPWFTKRILWWPGKIAGEWTVALSGASHQKDVYQTVWFDGPSIEFPFEDTTIPLPSGYDAYLTHMYGDYLQLPPVEKRVSHHHHFYIDLEQRSFPGK